MHCVSEPERLRYRMGKDRKLLLDTVKEYSERTTIHGINYVFASFLTFQDRIFWLVIFLGGLVFSVYLSIDAFIDWRKNMIITRFENSELPVTEIAFPAVTICNQGLNMDNVAMAVERDFYEWHDTLIRGAGREKRDTLQNMMGVYLKEKFDIGEGDPSILEIIQSTTSPGAASALVADSLTKTARRCSDQKEKKEAEHGPGPPDSQEASEPPEEVAGSECPVMRGFSLGQEGRSLAGLAGLEECSLACHKDPLCVGYSHRSAKSGSYLASPILSSFTVIKKPVHYGVLTVYSTLHFI